VDTIETNIVCEDTNVDFEEYHMTTVTHRLLLLVSWILRNFVKWERKTRIMRMAVFWVFGPCRLEEVY
jgi:hypothetical protein